MSATVDNEVIWPNKLTVFSVVMSDGVNDYYPATAKVEYRGVSERFEKALLTKLLEALPVLLSAVDDSTVDERLQDLCRALQLEGWRANAESEMRLTENAHIEQFLKTVPLMTEEEVRQRVSSTTVVDFSKLMQIRYDGCTYYFADQFEPDGSINPDCLQCWRALSSNPLRSEWENALWWTHTSGWLDGLAPRDIFREQPALMFDAATQQVLQYEV